MITLKEMLEQNYARILEALDSDLDEIEKDAIKCAYKQVANTLVNVNASAVVFEKAVMDHIGNNEYMEITKEMLHSGAILEKQREMHPDYPDEEYEDID